jgi:hypothetical protein
VTASHSCTDQPYAVMLVPKQQHGAAGVVLRGVHELRCSQHRLARAQLELTGARVEQLDKELEVPPARVVQPFVVWARDACVAALVKELKDREVPRLSIESRQNGADDHRTIVRSCLLQPRLMYDHRIGMREPMLWLADGFTWALGFGRHWLTANELATQRIGTVVSSRRRATLGRSGLDPEGSLDGRGR